MPMQSDRMATQHWFGVFTMDLEESQSFWFRKGQMLILQAVTTIHLQLGQQIEVSCLSNAITFRFLYCYTLKKENARKRFEPVCSGVSKVVWIVLWFECFRFATRKFSNKNYYRFENHVAAAGGPWLRYQCTKHI